MQQKHRIFIAINLPPEIKSMLMHYAKKYKDLPAKWVDPENLHITLAFLGNISDLELGNVCMAAKKEAVQHVPFSINLTNLSYGPDEKNPKMVWVATEKSRELSLLKRGVEEALSEVINFKPEERSFNPHITLARIQQMALRMMDLEERPQINENLDMSFLVESIEVMESILKKTGPQYSIVESYRLSDQ